MPTLFRRRPAPAEVPAVKSTSRPAAVPTYNVGAPSVAGRALPAAKAPRFQYPLRFWLPLRAIGYGLIFFGVLNFVSALVRVAVNHSLSLYTALVLIAALASLLFSVASGALIADALPSIELRPQGLAVTEFVRWRVLPWERIVQLRTMLLPGERYVIFVEYAGTPLSPEHVVYSLLAGLGPRAGIFYTSDIKGFDDLTRLILDARMRATPGLRVEDLIVEGVPMPVVEMAFNPLGTMAAKVPAPGADDTDEDGPPAERPVHQATPRQALVRMQLGLAAVPIALYWVDNLVNGGIPFLSNISLWTLIAGTVGLLVIGLLELPFVALAIQALGENFLGAGEFQVALDTYPYLEMPRVLAFMAMIALAAIQAPFFLIFIIWLVVIGYTAYLTLLFTMRLYRIGQNQALLAAGASALAQIFVLISYLMLHPPGLS